MARYEASTFYCQGLSNDAPWNLLVGDYQHALGTDPALSSSLFPFKILFGIQEPQQDQTWLWPFYPLCETCKMNSCQKWGLVLLPMNLYALKGLCVFFHPCSILSLVAFKLVSD